MLNSRIKLKYLYASQAAEDKGFSFLSYTDEAQDRMLLIPIGEDAYERMLSQTGRIFPTRGFVETLYRIFSDQEYVQQEIEIYGLRNGEYLARINNTLLDKSYEVRCEDALLWAMVSGSPIFVDRMLMERQSVPFTIQGKVAMPINIVPIRLLEDSLRKAVNEEKYEYASTLRDEINRRKKSCSYNGGELK